MKSIKQFVKIYFIMPLKQKYYRKLLRKKGVIGKNVLVRSKSTITNKTVIGNNVTINGMIIGGEGQVIIQDNVKIGRDCLIITSNHKYEYTNKLPYGDELISKNVTLCENVWVGQRVIILPGVTIGEGAVIQAGSVVSKSIPSLAVAGGNPAKPFKFRDKDDYYKRKFN